MEREEGRRIIHEVVQNMEAEQAIEVLEEELAELRKMPEPKEFE